jgi:hypothetical protein
MTFFPLVRNNKDYGTLMCTASNEVGTQRHPCVFHIILAGTYICTYNMVWLGDQIGPIFVYFLKITNVAQIFGLPNFFSTVKNMF